MIKILKSLFALQLFRYLFFATLAYFIDFYFYLFFINLFFSPEVSNIFSKIPASLFGYITHTKYTYQKKLFYEKKEMFLYFSTVTIYGPLSSLVIKFNLNFFDYYYSKLLTDVFLFLIVYLFTTFIVYKKNNIL
jgi:hypothetical protein